MRRNSPFLAGRLDGGPFLSLAPILLSHGDVIGACRAVARVGPTSGQRTRPPATSQFHRTASTPRIRQKTTYSVLDNNNCQENRLLMLDIQVIDDPAAA